MPRTGLKNIQKTIRKKLCKPRKRSTQKEVKRSTGCRNDTLYLSYLVRQFYVIENWVDEGADLKPFHFRADCEDPLPSWRIEWDMDCVG